MDISADGSMIVVAGSGSITTYDAKTLKKRNQITLSSNERPTRVLFTNEPEHIMALIGNQLCFYDMTKLKEPYKTISIDSGEARIAISDDGKYAAVAMGNNVVDVIDLENNTMFRRFSSNPGGSSIDFSPNGGQYVAAGTKDGPSMWEVITKKFLKIEAPSKIQIISLSFSHNGKLLAGGTKDQLFIWDVETRKLLDGNSKEWDFGKINVLEFFPGDELIALGTEDGVIHIIDVNTLAEKKFLSPPPISKTPMPITSIVLSPSGGFLVSGSTNAAMLRVWAAP